jgi:hypothetical protein
MRRGCAKLGDDKDFAIGLFRIETALSLSNLRLERKLQRLGQKSMIGRLTRTRIQPLSAPRSGTQAKPRPESWGWLRSLRIAQALARAI